MLAKLAPRQFYEWILYSHMEPFGEAREDYRIASIASLLANIVRDRQQTPEPYKIEDFILRFAEEEAAAKSTTKRTQTWQDQKRMAQNMVKLYNTIHERKTAKRTRPDRGDLS